MTLDPLLSAALPIQIHATAATLAVALGGLVLFRRKGTPLHKALGRTWALLMVVVATSSFFINEIRTLGPFSPIHLLALVTYVGIGAGIWHIRRGNVLAHRAAMQTTYFAALGLAGAFTLLPGRRMHDVLFGAGSGWVPAAVAIPLVLVATVGLWLRLMPRRRRRFGRGALPAS